jgi:hypothetical protein
MIKVIDKILAYTILTIPVIAVVWFVVKLFSI